MPNRTLALEVGRTTLRGVLVESTLRSERVLGLYETPRGRDGDLAADVRALAATHGLAWDEVIAALPGELVAHRILRLPFRDRKRLDQVVPFELESHLPFELDETVIDYQALDTEGDAPAVLAVLARKETVREHLAALTAAGVEPRVLDLAALAPLNLLRHANGAASEDAVLVLADSDRTTVALLRRGHLVGWRTLSLGDADPTDEIAGEVRWSLLALAENGGPPPATVWLGGAGAERPGLLDALGRALGASPRALDTLAVDAIPPTLRRRQSAFAVPLGLALRARGDGFGVDFRRGPFAYHREREALWGAMTGAGILAVVALVLMIASFVLEARRLEDRRDALRAEMRALFTAAMPGTRTIVNERAQLDAELAALEKRRQSYGRLAPSAPRAIDLLRALTVGAPGDVGLDVEELALEGDTLRVRGSTRAYEGVEALTRGLQDRPEFRKVEAGDVRASVDGQRVAFGLEITPAEGSRP